jgi:hypothetical protein
VHVIDKWHIPEFSIPPSGVKIDFEKVNGSWDVTAGKWKKGSKGS